MKKGFFSKFIVVLIIVLNVLFTLRILDIFETVGQEPMALIGAWFLFTGTELVSLASIKKTEKKNNYYESEEI